MLLTPLSHGSWVGWVHPHGLIHSVDVVAAVGKQGKNDPLSREVEWVGLW